MTAIASFVRLAAIVLLVSASVVAASVPAWAQPPVISFDQLATKLKVGQTVSVTDTAGAEQKGKILNLSPTRLTLTVDDTRHEFPAARVSTIMKHQRTSLLWGSLIGLGAGAAVGALWGGSSECTDATQEGCALMGAAFLGGIGAAAGVGIAALMPGYTRVVYQAPSASGGLRVTLAPSVVPQRKGVVIRVSF